jgi:ribA/ribD-fused uncharacterized protein
MEMGDKIMNIICFHAPDAEWGYMSNWYYSDFIVDGIGFSSMEQYMMYSKAMCFGDKNIAVQILNTRDVAVIKDLGRKVSGYNDHVWNGLRQIIIYDGLMAKFTQNIALRKALKATGNAILAEAAASDSVWGIGLSIKDERRFDMRNWRGRNLLGYALMLVRSKL